MAGKTSVILLAAGASRRMGRIKQLLPFQGEPALVFCLKRILATSISEVVVVLGHYRDLIMPVLEDLPVTVAVNPDPESQMADSVRVGVEAMENGATGVIIALADHPLVSSATYKLLRQLHELRDDRILIPTYLKRGGHPTLFPTRLLENGGKSRPLNEIVEAYRDKVDRLPLDDHGIVCDMDFPADYHRLLALVNAELIPT